MYFNLKDFLIYTVLFLLLLRHADPAPIGRFSTALDEATHLQGPERLSIKSMLNNTFKLYPINIELNPPNNNQGRKDIQKSKKIKPMKKIWIRNKSIDPGQLPQNRSIAGPRMIMHSIAYDSALVRIQQGMKDDVNRKAQSSPPFLKWLYRVYPIRIKEDEYKSQTRTNKNISPSELVHIKSFCNQLYSIIEGYINECNNLPKHSKLARTGTRTRTIQNVPERHGRTTSREESFVPGEIKPSCKKLQEKPKNLIESLIYITRPRSSRHQILRSEGIPYYRAENSRGNSKENTENYSEDEDKEYVEVLIKDQTFDKPDKKVGVLIQDNTVDDWLPVNEASYKGNNLEVETLSPSEAWKHLSQQQFLNNKHAEALQVKKK